MTRHLQKELKFLMAAMIIIGAGSAFAQSENLTEGTDPSVSQSESDYFSLTKNAGMESESTTYYPTLGDAVNDAADGDKITLLKDYTISPDHMTTDIYGVSINKSITLDLNDHKITRDNSKEIDEYRGVLISINAGATLTLVDNGADTGTMGSIENIDVYIGHAIVVGKGSKLIAKGVMILTPDRDTVDIDDDGMAEFDDCVIHGKVGINLYGTATITNSDISGGNSCAIRVGRYDSAGDDDHKGRLTIGDGVYISNKYIDYEDGTVILKALPTFGTERPTTSSTTRAKTRIAEYYDIAMKSGLSLTFEEGTFKTPVRPMIIKIADNNGPVDPATYTNPITTNYSKYVKDGGEVIAPNVVFKWEKEDFTKGFRMNTAGEVISNHAAATVTSYSGTTTSHYDFSEAIAAAKSGYKTASEAGGTEFIPVMKLLEDIDLGSNNYAIGDYSKSWSLTLDLNGHTLSGSDTRIFTVGKSLAIIDSSDGDTKGSLVSNYEGTNSGQVIHVNGGELTATGITISGGKVNGVNSSNGTVTLTGCTVSGLYGIQGSKTVNISGGEISGIKNAISLSSCDFYLNADEGSAPCSIIGGEYGIHFSSYIDFTLGSGVSISSCSIAGIYLQTNNNRFTALPTFGTGDDKNGIDIWLAKSMKMIFNEGSYTAPAQPITIKITNDSGSEPTADDLPKQFTTGYSEYVKDGNNVIDPATVFAYHDASLKFGIGSNDSGEAAVFATKQFSFAEGQTWMTWCDANTLSKPSGIDVYEITAVTPSAITTAKLTGDVIPAYTPLLLQKNGADGLTALLIGSPEAPTTGYDATTGIVSQTLTGATVYGATKDVDQVVLSWYNIGNTYYVLKGGEFLHLGDYHGFAQNRCWIGLSALAGARSLVIVNGEATGVNGVKDIGEAAGDSWYTATGRRLERRPVRKGIYIHRGQKMIIR